jgi:transcriptional regulator of acetoin/glycerol metabolism
MAPDNLSIMEQFKRGVREANARARARFRNRPGGRPWPTQRHSDASIIEALKAAKGKVRVAAKALGCHHSSIYERAKISNAVAACLPRG